MTEQVKRSFLIPLFIILIVVCVMNNLTIPTLLAGFGFGAYLQSLTK